MKISKFVQTSKWFHVNSKHYIMGHQREHENNTGTQAEKDFKRGYLKAYFKFMWLAREDWI